MDAAGTLTLYAGLVERQVRALRASAGSTPGAARARPGRACRPHGFFSCYEAFIHIVDSMFNQHAEWLKVARHLPWRRPISSLNYMLMLHVWRQDHKRVLAPGPRLHRHVVRLIDRLTCRRVNHKNLHMRG